MSDEEIPKQPTTVSLPAMTDRALLEEVVREMRGVRADIGLVSNDLGILKDRVGIIETWRTDQETRATKTSGGIRSLSQVNAQQDALIAQEHVARVELSSKVDILDTRLVALDRKIDDAARLQTQAIIDGIRDITTNPMVRRIGYAVGALILQALGVATTYYAIKGH